jgi:cell division protein FtsL
MKNQVRLPGLNRRLVMERDHGRVRELALAVGLSGLMLMPLLLYVWQNVEWIRIGYRVEKLQNRHDRLVELNQQLLLEKAHLESLARVEKVATERLGLALPPAGTVVMLTGISSAGRGDGRDAEIRQAD